MPAAVRHDDCKGYKSRSITAFKLRRRVSGGAAIHFEDAQVVTAVESLYRDQIKPLGRILLRRLAEQLLPGGAGRETFACSRALRRICEAVPQLKVVSEEGGEYTVLLADRLSDFVDPCDLRDPYPEELWEELTVFFQESGDKLMLPGGRYTSAHTLADLGIPCLAVRSLGEICHILALAVTPRRILGYSKGHMVPFFQSELGMKERCAAMQMPVSCARSLPLASWDSVRTGLWQLLHSGGEGSSIPLPNIKRLFRSKFALELSETALGYSRVQEVLQDERLRDTCEVRRTGSMSVVAKARPRELSARAVPFCPQRLCPGVPWQQRNVSSRSPTTALGCGSTVVALPKDGELVDDQLGAATQVCQPLESAAQAEATTEKRIGLSVSPLDISYSSDSSTLDGNISDTASTSEVSAWSPGSLANGLFSELLLQKELDDDDCSYLKNTFIHIAPPSPYSQAANCKTRHRSVPGSLRLCKSKCFSR